MSDAAVAGAAEKRERAGEAGGRQRERTDKLEHCERHDLAIAAHGRGGVAAWLGAGWPAMPTAAASVALIVFAKIMDL